jgi:hypothetical protein
MMAALLMIPLIWQSMSSFKAFLSLLAVAEADDLDYVQCNLLPHRIVLHREPFTPPAYKTSQAPPYESRSRTHTTENAKPPGALPSMDFEPASSAEESLEQRTAVSSLPDTLH